MEIESNLCTLTFRNVKDIKSKKTAYESFIAFNTHTERKSISKPFSKEEEKKEKKEKKKGAAPAAESAASVDLIDLLS